MKPVLLLFLLFLITACQQAPIKSKTKHSRAKISSLSQKLLVAEKKASKEGRKILATGRKMTLIDKKVVRGSCWDFANAVYNDAGYPNKKKKRLIVFKGKKRKGPYAKQNLIKAGDFLYYINHSYHDGEHSAIFVSWLSYKKKTALMLSYAGQNKKTPARYKAYDLSHVYHIIRPKSLKK
ncbi:MAG: hypothetical protein GQ569_11500 [Methylococcaceae bacterium]|nr:hypothetical protein [Methylococcaceae bacterium]